MQKRSTENREPATQRQLDYARDLNIDIPPNPSKDEMAYLISMRLDNDKPATERHIGFAECFNIDVSLGIGKKALFDRIKWELEKPERETDLIAWFVFRVYRQLVHGVDNAPIDSPNHPIIRDIATHLSYSTAVLKSIRKYQGRSLIAFGDWVSPSGNLYQGGSTKTIAYRETASLLREKLNLPHTSHNEAPSNSSSNRKARKAKNKSNEASNDGCASVIILFFFLYLVYLYIRH